jgi:hypothetical protein
MLLRESDKDWLRINYPELTALSGTSDAYQGLLAFDMLYDKAGQQYIINPNGSSVSDRMRIRDKYTILVDFNGSSDVFPSVRETGGRIQKVATDRKLHLADVHLNLGGDACLCFELERPTHLPDGFNLPEFFRRLVIPFFFAESFFEKYNYWPWGQRSHGVLGMFEWYLDNAHRGMDAIESSVEFLKRHRYKTDYGKQLRGEAQIKGHQHCPCGSSFIFRKCHERSFRGLWKLHDDIETLSKVNETNKQRLKELLNGF